MTLSLNSASISQILEPILQGLICSVKISAQEQRGSNTNWWQNQLGSELSHQNICLGKLSLVLRGGNHHNFLEPDDVWCAQINWVFFSFLFCNVRRRPKLEFLHLMNFIS